MAAWRRGERADLGGCSLPFADLGGTLTRPFRDPPRQSARKLVVAVYLTNNMNEGRITTHLFQQTVYI